MTGKSETNGMLAEALDRLIETDAIRRVLLTLKLFVYVWMILRLFTRPDPRHDLIAESPA